MNYRTQKFTAHCAKNPVTYYAVSPLVRTNIGFGWVCLSLASLYFAGHFAYWLLK